MENAVVETPPRLLNTKTEQEASDELAQEEQRTEQFSAEIAELKKRAGPSDSFLRAQVEIVDRKWSAILKARESKLESYKERREELKQSDNKMKSALESLPQPFAVQGPISTSAAGSGKPVFDYDSNVSADALVRANATPEMLDIYRQLPADQKQAMQVQSVLNDLKTVDNTTQGCIKSLHLDLASVEAGVPISKMSDFVEASGVALKDIYDIVIPARTLKHRRARSESLSRDESDKLARLVRVFDQAIAIFGDTHRARTWMQTPKRRFAERQPLEMLRTEIGARMVEEMLGQIDEGMFA